MTEQELQAEVDRLKQEKMVLEQRLAEVGKKAKEYKERWLLLSIQNLLDEHDAEIKPVASAQIVISSTE